MAASPMPVPNLGAMPKAMPVSGMKAPQLYAGGTNSTGMQMPVSTSSGPTSSNFGMPTVSANPGTSGPMNATGLTGSNASRLLGENQNYLGQGVGAMVTNYLNSGAGYNGPLAQQTINATDQAMQQQINLQYGDLQTNLGNAGLSPNSSASALASSNFMSNASAQENMVAAQQYTQMYAQSQQDYLQAMQDVMGINNVGTMNQTTPMGNIAAFMQGGIPGMVGYNSGAAGTAGPLASMSSGLTSAISGIAGMF
ncbi:MAG: hypothetical protein ACYCOU_15920 [Sulfobacillus sp.]